MTIDLDSMERASNALFLAGGCLVARNAVREHQAGDPWMAAAYVAGLGLIFSLYRLRVSLCRRLDQWVERKSGEAKKRR